MDTDILNIEYHLKKLLLKALNRAETIAEAARLTGVTKKTIRKYQRMYNIQYCPQEKQYFIN
jgi:hypothetical protein